MAGVAEWAGPVRVRARRAPLSGPGLHLRPGRAGVPVRGGPACPV